MRFTDPGCRPRFERLLDLLGDSGLGGRRSSGSGAFAWRVGAPLAVDIGASGKRVVLLSRYLPRPNELAALRSNESAYRLVNVGGWLFSPGEMSQRRQRVRMIVEGSVIDAGAGALRGRIVDVRPDYSKSGPHPLLGAGVGTPHPVYRSGLGSLGRFWEKGVGGPTGALSRQASLRSACGSSADR